MIQRPPSFTLWEPLPAPAPPRRLERLLGLWLLALALLALAATLVIGRADSAANAGQFAAAIRWRPGVAAYHRQWGEALLLRSPPQAEAQLLQAAKLDPDDPQTFADLTTAELALGRWPQAIALTQTEQGRAPSFADAWRLANLFLARGDLAGFWQQAGVAARRADPSYFPSIASRALSASHGDFPRLRRMLPPDSVAAASAYLQAAVQAGQLPPAQAGARWLLALPPPSDAPTRAARQAALAGLLLAAWQRWPSQALGVWNDLGQAHLLPLPAKAAHAPYLRDGSFSLGARAQLAPLAPDPADPLRAVLGWRWPSPPDVGFDPVATGDATHATAAELQFDGREGDDVDLTQQWILAEAGTPLHVAAWSRALGQPQQGLSLRLSDLQGHLVGELPLPLASQWQAAQATFSWRQLGDALSASGRPLPGIEARTPSDHRERPRQKVASHLAAPGVQTYQLSLHYHRPLGQLPLNGALLVSGLRLW
ncbi:MAG TPA: hypothetical protein VNF74_11105 [Terriglobales bacterium]|nr:hypothetical protein [Terriglobales bacterium]